MAVSAGYLTKIRRAVRANSSVDIDAEITDIIEECRLDLQSLGVVSAKTTDETDSLILGAVRSFARWKFGFSNDDAAANRDDYMLQKDELRRKRDYLGYAITFIVKTGNTATADAVITFNGQTQETNSAGTAIFYYVAGGVNQEYTVASTGYISQVVDLDVTATVTVNVAMIAG
jgi:hypothetical protein